MAKESESRMGSKKKSKIEDFNGKVVFFTSSVKDHTYFMDKIATDWRQCAGISFTSSDDYVINPFDGYYRANVIFKNNLNEIQHYRFPIQNLKIVSDSVPPDLKQATLKELKAYLIGTSMSGEKYISNLLYLEALQNINKIKEVIPRWKTPRSLTY